MCFGISCCTDSWKSADNLEEHVPPSWGFRSKLSNKSAWSGQQAKRKDGGDMFLWSISWLSVNCMALYPIAAWTSDPPNQLNCNILMYFWWGPTKTCKIDKVVKSKFHCTFRLRKKTVSSLRRKITSCFYSSLKNVTFVGFKAFCLHSFGSTWTWIVMNLDIIKLHREIVKLSCRGRSLFCMYF